MVKSLGLWSWQRWIQGWVKLRWSPKCDQDVKKTNFKYYNTTGTEIKQCTAVQVSSKTYFSHLAVRHPVPTGNWSCYVDVLSSNHQSRLTKVIILACRTAELLVYLCQGCLVCFWVFMWLSRVFRSKVTGLNANVRHVVTKGLSERCLALWWWRVIHLKYFWNDAIRKTSSQKKI